MNEKNTIPQGARFSVMFILFNNFSHRRRECVGSCLFKRVEQYSNINFGFVYTETEGSFASKKNLISN